MGFDPETAEAVRQHLQDIKDLTGYETIVFVGIGSERVPGVNQGNGLAILNDDINNILPDLQEAIEGLQKYEADYIEARARGAYPT